MAIVYVTDRGIQSTNAGHKLTYYSGHDGLILALFSALGLEKNEFGTIPSVEADCVCSW